MCRTVLESATDQTTVTWADACAAGGAANAVALVAAVPTEGAQQVPRARRGGAGRGDHTDVVLAGRGGRRGATIPTLCRRPAFGRVRGGSGRPYRRCVERPAFGVPPSLEGSVFTAPGHSAFAGRPDVGGRADTPAGRQTDVALRGRTPARQAGDKRCRGRRATWADGCALGGAAEAVALVAAVPNRGTEVSQSGLNRFGVAARTLQVDPDVLLTQLPLER